MFLKLDHNLTGRTHTHKKNTYVTKTIERYPSTSALQRDGSQFGREIISAHRAMIVTTDFDVAAAGVRRGAEKNLRNLIDASA